MNFPIGNDYYRGNAAAQIDQGVQFDSSFVFAKPSPWEKRQTEIDRCCIQCLDSSLEMNTELVLDVETAAAIHKDRNRLDRRGDHHRRLRDEPSPLECRFGGQRLGVGKAEPVAAGVNDSFQQPSSGHGRGRIALFTHRAAAPGEARGLFASRAGSHRAWNEPERHPLRLYLALSRSPDRLLR